jgi:hypothetical protein
MAGCHRNSQGEKEIRKMVNGKEAAISQAGRGLASLGPKEMGGVTLRGTWSYMEVGELELELGLALHRFIAVAVVTGDVSRGFIAIVVNPDTCLYLSLPRHHIYHWSFVTPSVIVALGKVGPGRPVVLLLATLGQTPEMSWGKSFATPFF